MSTRPSHIEDFDRRPPGWFVLGVNRADARKWDWVVLMVNYDPDSDPGRPNSYNRETATLRAFRIPGKYRNMEAARYALKDLM
jgi:hypothetical protein